jgi:hypothetical protein
LRELGYNSDVSKADYTVPFKDSNWPIKTSQDKKQTSLSQREEWILMSSFVVNKNISIPQP